MYWVLGKHRVEGYHSDNAGYIIECVNTWFESQIKGDWLREAGEEYCRLMEHMCEDKGKENHSPCKLCNVPALPPTSTQPCQLCKDIHTLILSLWIYYLTWQGEIKVADGIKFTNQLTLW